MAPHHPLIHSLPAYPRGLLVVREGPLFSPSSPISLSYCSPLGHFFHVWFILLLFLSVPRLFVYVLNQLVLPSERSKPVLVLLAVRHRCAFEGLGFF